MLKIPTGRILTSWLLKSHGGVESGITKHKSIQRQQGGRFEPGTLALQVQCPKH